jgi:hypothetical protein
MRGVNFRPLQRGQFSTVDNTHSAAIVPRGYLFARPGEVSAVDELIMSGTRFTT